MARLVAVMDVRTPASFFEFMERCRVKATGSEIQMEDSPDTVRPQRLADLEQAYIDAALERHSGNRRRTAEELGIS
jgi:transcriptional regulator with PAS, ATPase and Fis domain